MSSHEMVTERPEAARSLSRAEILDMVKAVHENAVALAEEAEILLQAGRTARAYALAEAAAEELGKLVLLDRVCAEVAMGGGKVDWAGFWDKFHDHGPKAWNAAFLDHLLSEQPADCAAGNVDAVHANVD